MFNVKTICRLTKKSKIKKLQNVIKEKAMLGGLYGNYFEFLY